MDFGLFALRRKFVALADADVEIEVVMYPGGGGGGGSGGSGSSASAAKLLRLPLLLLLLLATELSDSRDNLVHFPTGARSSAWASFLSAHALANQRPVLRRAGGGREK